MVNWFYIIIMWGNGMKEVFISYSTKDQIQAETVRDILEKNAIPCWMAPRDIPGGSNYTKEIPIAIRNCKVFVLILSEIAPNMGSINTVSTLSIDMIALAANVSNPKTFSST